MVMQIPFKIVRPVALAFAVLAGPPASAAPADRDLTPFVAGQVKQGVRGILVGEAHDHAGLPALVGAQAKNLNAQADIQTLYLEYYSNSRQPVLDKALTGDATAQRTLYADFAASSLGRRNMAARYNLLFKARKAGMRVIGIDNSIRNMPQYLDPHGNLTQMRMTFGDAYMSSVIKKNDDGRPFMAIVGQYHTAVEPLLVFGKTAGSPSPWGGMPPRLADQGISTMVINVADMPAIPGLPSLMPQKKLPRPLDGQAAVRGTYELSMPAERADSVPPNRFARAHGLVRFLRELAPLSAPERVAPQLENKFMACATATEIAAVSQKYVAAYQPYLKASLPKGEQARQKMTAHNLQRLTKDVRSPHFAAAQRELCSKSGEKLWRRAMP